MENYRITTKDVKFILPKPLPTADEVNSQYQEVTLIGEWKFVSKVEFLKNGVVDETIFGDLGNPKFTAKGVYKGKEVDLLCDVDNNVRVLLY